MVAGWMVGVGVVMGGVTQGGVRPSLTSFAPLLVGIPAFGNSFRSSSRLENGIITGLGTDSRNKHRGKPILQPRHSGAEALVAVRL